MTSPTSPDAAPDSVDYAPFAHLTAPNTVLYRAVMRTFLAAKERFAVHLRPEGQRRPVAPQWPGEPTSVEPVPAPEVAVQAVEPAATPRDQVVSVVDLEEEFQKPRPEVEFVAFDPE